MAAPPFPPTYLHGHRDSWATAPVELRTFVQDALGEPVQSWRDHTGGMSTGIAATVHGRRRAVFVKAVARADHPRAHQLYRREADTARHLPTLPHVPGWITDADLPTTAGSWAVCVTEAVDGRPISHPWSTADLTATLDAWHEVTRVLHTVRWDAHAEMADFLGRWREVLDRPDDPLAPLLRPWRHRLEVMTAVVDGTPDQPPVLSHIDLRADNILRDQHGRVWFVDWAHPARCASWVDPALLLADVVASGGDRADGGQVDVLGVWTTHRATRDHDADLMLAVLAGLAAALNAGRQRPNRELPHQARWQQAMIDGLRPFLTRHS